MIKIIARIVGLARCKIAQWKAKRGLGKFQQKIKHLVLKTGMPTELQNSLDEITQGKAVNR